MTNHGTLNPDYDEDWYAWAEKNAELLRQGRLSEIDAHHIAEELEDMGRSERHALAGHLKVLIIHLLKWRYQPAFRGVSWQLSVDNARDEIDQLLADSPSLDDIVSTRYRAARKRASVETGLALDIFPETCPFSIKQLIDESYWPG